MLATKQGHVPKNGMVNLK